MSLVVAMIPWRLAARSPEGGVPGVVRLPRAAQCDARQVAACLQPTSLTLMMPADYHGVMAGKPSRQQFRAPPGRGGQWLELTVMLPSASAESLGETLVALGSPGVVQESVQRSGGVTNGQALEMARVIAAFPMEQVTERLLGAVRRVLDDLWSAAGTQPVLSMQVIDGGAWAEQWKRFYRPFKIGKRLVIRPPWEPYTAAADELLLTLNPGQAFGTGLHPTTQLCLACVEAIVGTRPGVRLLDVGCGSGILGLAGVLFGCAEAFGIDVDRLAVWVARVNARLNHLAKQATFAAGSLEMVTDRYDLVVANILLEPILAMLDPLHTAIVPGGAVVLAGMLTTEVPHLWAGLSAHGWRITHQASQEEWTAVICEEA
jgi:ribosomal protein L11 methyltransferase